ncbi:MAG: hypothetical protein ACI39F_03985, partial [Acutalibacteraceae bacterium]
DSVNSKKYVATEADGPVLSESPVEGDGRNQVIKIENCVSKGSVYARLRLKLTNANVAVPENCIGFKFDLYTADSVTMGVLGKNASAATLYGNTHSLSRIKGGKWVTIYDIIDTSKCQPSDIGIVDIILNYGTESSPTSSAAVYVDNISFLTVDEIATDALTVDGKASIRLGTVSGIRFYTTYDESRITGTVTEKGTLIGPKDLIGDYLTIEDTQTELGASPKAVAVKYNTKTFWNDNEFVGSIVGILPQNYNREFVARAYVRLEDGTYLYSATTTTKTVAKIADAFKTAATKEGASKEDSELYQIYKAQVDTWAAANV